MKKITSFCVAFLLSISATATPAANMNVDQAANVLKNFATYLFTSPLPMDSQDTITRINTPSGFCIKPDVSMDNIDVLINREKSLFEQAKWDEEMLLGVKKDSNYIRNIGFGIATAGFIPAGVVMIPGMAIEGVVAVLVASMIAAPATVLAVNSVEKQFATFASRTKTNDYDTKLAMRKLEILSKSNCDMSAVIQAAKIVRTSEYEKLGADNFDTYNRLSLGHGLARTMDRIHATMVLQRYAHASQLVYLSVLKKQQE